MKRALALSAALATSCLALGCEKGRSVSLGRSIPELEASVLETAEPNTKPAEPPPEEPPPEEPPPKEPPPEPPPEEPPPEEPPPMPSTTATPVDAAPVFGDVTFLASVSSTAKDDNPTLSSDQLLLCFSSVREIERDGGVSGDSNIWCAERLQTSQPFGTPVPANALNTVGFESSPALGQEGLEIWWGSKRPDRKGDVDIWQARRADRKSEWTKIQAVDSLNTASDDVPRPMGGPGQTTMPLGSRRGAGNIYRTYLAKRDSDGDFSKPALIDELSTDTGGAIDAFLTEDGLSLYFTRRKDGAGDLHVARRPTEDGRFRESVALEGVNTRSDERDPWLSPDGRNLYFASNRRDGYDLYHAVLLP